MLPKVSILIPTCNRHTWFEQALKSALNQTYENIEIIICDNSDNNKTRKVVNRLRENHPFQIRYIKNDKNIGPLPNQQKCLDLATGEYINFLMDDDLFAPTKIEKMMDCFLRFNGITLVSSSRQRISEKGKPGMVCQLFKRDKNINGIKLGNKLLRQGHNLIGEPSNVLFRKKDLVEPFGVFMGVRAEYSVDFATWLNLLSIGNAVYLAETLSYFRKHSRQLSKHPLAKLARTVDWLHFIEHAPEKGFLKSGRNQVGGNLSPLQLELSKNKLDRILHDPSMMSHLQRLGKLQATVDLYANRKMDREARRKFRKNQVRLGLEDKGISHVMEILERFQSYLKRFK